MRTEYTEDGWKEITTKVIKITMASEKPFSPLSEWVAFNERFPKMGKKRQSCNRCKTKWDKLDINSNIWFLHTDKGNKIVCDNCHKEINGKK